MALALTITLALTMTVAITVTMAMAVTVTFAMAVTVAMTMVVVVRMDQTHCVTVKIMAAVKKIVAVIMGSSITLTAGVTNSLLWWGSQSP